MSFDLILQNDVQLFLADYRVDAIDSNECETYSFRSIESDNSVG